MVRDVCRDPFERYTANPECANERIRMNCGIIIEKTPTRFAVGRSFWPHNDEVDSNKRMTVGEVEAVSLVDSGVRLARVQCCDLVTKSNVCSITH